MLTRLRRRLTMLAAVLTGSVVVAVAAVSFLLCGRMYTAQRQAAFEAAVSDLASQWELDSALDWQRIQDSAARNSIRFYFAENGSALLLSGLTEESDRALVWQALRQAGFDPDTPPLSAGGQAQALERVELTGGDARVTARKQATGRGWRLLVAWQPLAGEQRVLRRTAAVFLLVALAGVALLAALCWLVAGRAIRPVRRAMDQQREFVRAAGHELRTPLGVLRAGLAVLPGEDPDTARRHIGLLDSEAARMGGLIDQLLILSGGGLVQPGPAQRLEPDTLLLEMAEAWEPAARRAGRRIEAALPPEPLPPVQASREELCQILSIFLDNALRYAPAGSAVELACCQRGRRMVWEVRDHGPGVPDADKPAVFRRFWRAESSRADRQHFGLGLSVAAELAERCRLQLGVADMPGGGACFWVAAGL